MLTTWSHPLSISIFCLQDRTGGAVGGGNEHPRVNYKLVSVVNLTGKHLGNGESVTLVTRQELSVRS